MLVPLGFCLLSGCAYNVMSFSLRGACPAQKSALGLATEALGPNRTVAELIPYVVQVWPDTQNLELLVLCPARK